MLETKKYVSLMRKKKKSVSLMLETKLSCCSPFWDCGVSFITQSVLVTTPNSRRINTRLTHQDFGHETFHLTKTLYFYACQDFGHKTFHLTKTLYFYACQEMYNMEGKIPSDSIAYIQLNAQLI